MTPPPAVRLSIPATSANLGPGFDCLGLAVDLQLQVRARPAESDAFIYRGDGTLPDDPANLMHAGFAAACREVGRPRTGVSFEVDNPIPLARGLGSSSAALVAGAAAADALLGQPLGRDGVFQLVAGLEGHPDNAAPAVYGGFTVSALDERGRFVSRSLPLPEAWCLLFAVPATLLPTETARGVLPDSFRRSDAVTTASRASLWTLAVATDEPELLRVACRDVLHQPYRAALLPGFTETVEAALAAGAYAAFLSGAGPTLAAVAGRKALPAVRRALAPYAGADGRVLELRSAGGYRARLERPVEAEA